MNQNDLSDLNGRHFDPCSTGCYIFQVMGSKEVAEHQQPKSLFSGKRLQKTMENIGKSPCYQWVNHGKSCKRLQIGRGCRLSFFKSWNPMENWLPWQSWSQSPKPGQGGKDRSVSKPKLEKLGTETGLTERSAPLAVTNNQFFGNRNRIDI